MGRISMILTFFGGGGGGGGFPNTAGGSNTAHGAQRLRERGFTDDEIILMRQTSDIRTQSDGARVYIREMSPGRFNVIVQGERGVITAFRNIRQGALDRLVKNYGWK